MNTQITKIRRREEVKGRRMMKITWNWKNWSFKTKRIEWIEIYVIWGIIIKRD